MLCGSVDERRAGEYMAEVRTSSQCERPCAGIEETRKPPGDAGGSSSPVNGDDHTGKRLAGKPHEPFERADGGRAKARPPPTLHRRSRVTPAEGRDPTLRPRRPANQRWEEPVSEAKPFAIPKQLVWDAYQRVKANGGAAGVDGVSLAAFETDLKNNLYKVWNRMASGSYHPPPVRLVEIPKATGGTRPLGIPTVADRVAQTVVTMVLEPLVEPHFHPDSYAYRPGRSALDAVGTARKRCWRTDWVIDLDIKAFFDSMPRDLIERAVAHHTDLAWVKLYVGRWLRAPSSIRTEPWRSGRRAPRKGASSHHSWPTSSCTMRSIAGWRGSTRTSGSSATRTMRSSIAGARRRRGLCWRPSGVVWRTAVWSFIPRRPGSSTARTTTGRGARTHRVRLPRLHLPTATGEEPVGAILRQLPAGDQHQGRDGDPADHPQLADGVHQEQPAPGGSGSPCEPGGAGLAELLRAVLSLAVRSGAPSLQ